MMTRHNLGVCHTTRDTFSIEKSGYLRARGYHEGAGEIQEGSAMTGIKRALHFQA